MATAQTDYEGWTIPFYWANRDEELKAALEGIATFFRAKVAASGAAAEPGDFLAGIELGDSAAHNDGRLYYDGTNILIQKNTGTEGTPVWATVWTLVLATGAITTAAGVTLGGTLNANGNLITNATSVNGVSPTAHASRHLPGGADALTVATASDVGSANAAGSAASFSRSDHVHKGLHSMNSTGFGDITMAAGNGMTVTGTSTVTYTNEILPRGWRKIHSSPITLSSTSEVAFSTYSNLALSEANAARDFMVTFMVSLAATTTANEVTWRLRAGSNGDITDALIGLAHSSNDTTGGDVFVSFSKMLVNPASGVKLTISYEAAVTGAGAQSTNDSSVLYAVPLFAATTI